jgi:hypothetical protein
MGRLGRAFLYDRDIFVTYLVFILAIPQGAFAWGREGHQIIVILAGHYMRPETATRMRELLAPESPEEVSGWADEYRREHRETGPWHYIDIPLADSEMDLARECPNGDWVIAKTEQFLAVLRDPNGGKDANPDFSPRGWKGGAEAPPFRQPPNASQRGENSRPLNS